MRPVLAGGVWVSPRSGHAVIRHQGKFCHTGLPHAATLHLVDTFSGMGLEDAERALYLYQVQGGELRTRQQRFYALGRDIVGEDHGQPDLTDLPDTLGDAMKRRIARLRTPEQTDYEVIALGGLPVVGSPTSPSTPQSRPQPRHEGE